MFILSQFVYSLFLCYNTQALNNKNIISTTLKCNQCGSELVLQETGVRQTGNSFSSTTVTKYRCSNQVCQDEIDKNTAKRIELKIEQDKAKQRRLANMTNKSKPQTVA